MNKLISSLLASETPSSSGRVIKIAGATTNDRSNQNETYTKSRIHILQLHTFFVKFKNVVSDLKNKDTN
jgi:hypothetical protein